MPTLGLLFILGGILLGRQVIVGRVKETPQDIRDITLNILEGDFPALQRTLALRGENASPDVSSTVAAGMSGEAPGYGDLLTQTITGSLLSAAVARGSKAKGYKWSATGPDYYDCSGLVWQAMRDAGYYKGPRFTTSTFVRQLGNKISLVRDPMPGDIVLWPGRHIGIVSGTDQMYSALNPHTGIGYSSISSVTANNGGHQPVYYRLTEIGQASIDHSGSGFDQFFKTDVVK